VFIHVLDVGTAHEPSHHLIFEYKNLIPEGAAPSSPFLCLSPINFTNLTNLSDEKHDLSAKTGIALLFEDFSRHIFELNSSVLLPLLEKADVKLKLSLLHFLLIHVHDLNAAKRVSE
jgi:hypothetical protein